MDRSYGRGAARRIFWQGILDRSYEGVIRFFVATLCCRRQLNAFWQMLAWLALALPPLALLGSQQPAAEAGNASAVVVRPLFLFLAPFLDPSYEPPRSYLFLRLHFWTPVMDPNSLFSPCKLCL